MNFSGAPSLQSFLQHSSWPASGLVAVALPVVAPLASGGRQAGGDRPCLLWGDSKDGEDSDDRGDGKHVDDSGPAGGGRPRPPEGCWQAQRRLVAPWSGTGRLQKLEHSSQTSF